MGFVGLVDMTDNIGIKKGLKQKKESGGNKKRRWQAGSFLLADKCIGKYVFALSCHVDVDRH